MSDFLRKVSIFGTVTEFSKKLFSVIFFSFSASTCYLKGNKTMISHIMKHFQNGTHYSPLLHFLLDATIFTTINDEKEGNINQLKIFLKDFP